MSEFEPISAELDWIAKRTVDAIFKVHSTLGPGLLESVYETCLIHELRLRSISCLAQVALPINYAGLEIDAGLTLDLLIENELIVELKAVEVLQPVHKAQLLTYLKLANKRIGLLVNFNVPRTKDGIHRMVR